MRRGAAGLLLGMMIVVAGSQSASAAVCWFGCKPTTPTTQPPRPAPTPTVPAAPAPAPAPATFDPAAAAQRILDLSNVERAAVGLGPLVMRDDVVAIARDHSAAMAAAQTIWHNEQYLTTEVRTALGAGMLGENVGMGGSVDSIHAGFMESPGHKANVLEPRFNVVGMAVVKAGSTLFITQDFVEAKGAPRPAVKKAAAPKPVAVKAASRPRPAPRPRAVPAPAPPTTVPAVTVPPETITTFAPTSSTRATEAAFAAAPVAATSGAGEPAPESAAPQLIALALVAASSTGALRVTRRASARR